MEDLVLIGGGGHCLSCVDVIKSEKKFRVVGIVDKNIQINKGLKCFNVLGNDNQLLSIIKKYNNALITVGQIKTNEPRIRLFKQLKEIHANLPSIKSPLGYCAENVKIGEGTIIMHNVTINSLSRIENNCIVNTNAVLEHEVVVNSNCHISTGVIVNGGSIIGEGTFIGSGSIIYENIEIGKNCVIPAGSIIKKNFYNN